MDVKMKKYQTYTFWFFLAAMTFGTCFAGPRVSPPKNAEGVNIRNNEFEIERVISDPQKIEWLQNAFHRAKKVGDTKSHLKNPTHKIDLSDRWLIDLQNGEIGVLSKAATDVYQITQEDLEALQKLIQDKP